MFAFRSNLTVDMLELCLEMSFFIGITTLEFHLMTVHSMPKSQMVASKSSSSRLDQVIDQISIKVNKSNKLQNVQQQQALQQSQSSQSHKLLLSDEGKGKDSPKTTKAVEIPSQHLILPPRQPSPQHHQIQQSHHLLPQVSNSLDTAPRTTSSTANIFISEQTEDCFENSFFTMALDPLCGGKDSSIVDFTTATASLVDVDGGPSLLAVNNSSAAVTLTAASGGGEKEKTETLCAVEALIECSDSRSLGHFGEIVKPATATAIATSPHVKEGKDNAKLTPIREEERPSGTTVEKRTTYVVKSKENSLRTSVTLQCDPQPVKFAEANAFPSANVISNGLTLSNIQNVVLPPAFHPRAPTAQVQPERAPQPIAKTSHVGDSKSISSEVAVNQPKKLNDVTTSRPSSSLPICDVCGKTYSSNSKLRKHRETVHEGKTTPCPICGKEMKSHSLPDHISFHKNGVARVNKKQFACSVCGKVFKTKACVERHENALHNNVKHACNICGQKFSFKEALSNHILCIHQGIKKFPCLVAFCDSVFSCTGNRSKHMKMVHSGKASDRETSRNGASTKTKGRAGRAKSEKGVEGGQSGKKGAKTVKSGSKRKRKTEVRCKGEEEGEIKLGSPAVDVAVPYHLPSL